MGCRQCLPLSVVQLKGKHCRKPLCRNGVVDVLAIFEVCNSVIINGRDNHSVDPSSHHIILKIVRFYYYQSLNPVFGNTFYYSIAWFSSLFSCSVAIAVARKATDNFLFRLPLKSSLIFE